MPPEKRKSLWKRMGAWMLRDVLGTLLGAALLGGLAVWLHRRFGVSHRTIHAIFLSIMGLALITGIYAIYKWEKEYARQEDGPAEGEATEVDAGIE